MKKIEFPTKYTESVQKGTFEVNTAPSMTEPDNAMSIPEIIARFTRGQGIAVQQHPWSTGSAPEGDQFIQDDFSDVVPGMPAPQASQAPAALADPEPPTPAPAPGKPQEPQQVKPQVYPGGPGESAHVIEAPAAGK